jgi:hypothetical protein
MEEDRDTERLFRKRALARDLRRTAIVLVIWAGLIAMLLGSVWFWMWRDGPPVVP